MGGRVPRVGPAMSGTHPRRLGLPDPPALVGSIPPLPGSPFRRWTTGSPSGRRGWSSSRGTCGGTWDYPVTHDHERRRLRPQRDLAGEVEVTDLIRLDLSEDTGGTLLTWGGRSGRDDVYRRRAGIRGTGALLSGHQLPLTIAPRPCRITRRNVARYAHYDTTGKNPLTTRQTGGITIPNLLPLFDRYTLNRFHGPLAAGRRAASSRRPRRRGCCVDDSVTRLHGSRSAKCLKCVVRIAL